MFELMSFFMGFAFFVILLVLCWGTNDELVQFQFAWVIFGLSVLVFISNGFYAFVTANFLYILGYLIVFHFPLGVGWSLYEWKLFVQKRLERANLRFKNPDGTFISQKEDMIGMPHSYSKDRWEQEKPKLSIELGRISSWIVFWPIHLVEYFLFELLTDLCKSLIKRFGFVFERIVNNTWK